MNNLKEIFKFLNTAEKLKSIKRKVNISDNSRAESPAEHSWRVALMAVIFHKELNLDLDLLKAIKIILVHDIVEIFADDDWNWDRNSDKKMQQKNKEYQAAKEIYNQLPKDIGQDLQKLWIEYEESSTTEAKFAKALDKIEVIVQRADLGAENWENREFDIYKVLSHWADDSIKEMPKLEKFWKLVQDEITEQYDIKLRKNRN